MHAIGKVNAPAILSALSTVRGQVRLVANRGDAQQALALAHEHGIAKSRNQGTVRTLLFFHVARLI